jgi:hypothetical protein
VDYARHQDEELGHSTRRAACLDGLVDHLHGAVLEPPHGDEKYRY